MKKLNLRQHARARAQERFGITLSKDLRRTLLRKIHNVESVYHRRLTVSRSLHVVEHEGVLLPIVYSKSASDIVTMLPNNAWQLIGVPGFPEAQKSPEPRIPEELCT
jgi:hypothetical protein